MKEDEVRLILWFSRVSHFKRFSLSGYGGRFSEQYLKHRIKTYLVVALKI
jgi:hypothetical protein